MIPDINLLVALQRPDHAHCQTARTWLSEHSARDGQLVLLDLVVAGFMRIVTHNKIYSQPTSTQDAIIFIDTLLSDDRVSWSKPKLQESWQAFSALSLRLSIKQNDVPDAWIAAQARAQNTSVVTFDKGFKKLLPPQRLVILKV